MSNAAKEPAICPGVMMVMCWHVVCGLHYREAKPARQLLNLSTGLDASLLIQHPQSSMAAPHARTVYSRLIAGTLATLHILESQIICYIVVLKVLKQSCPSLTVAVVISRTYL